SQSPSPRSGRGRVPPTPAREWPGPDVIARLSAVWRAFMASFGVVGAPSHDPEGGLLGGAAPHDAFPLVGGRAAMTNLQAGCLALAAAGLALLFSREWTVKLGGVLLAVAAGLLADLSSTGWMLVVAVGA